MPAALTSPMEMHEMHETHESPRHARPAAPRASASARLVGIDAARVVAIALVVLLHACVAYLERPITGLLWPVQESPGETWWVDATFWIVRALGVPIVTLIAGYFTARALDAMSYRQFLQERARRLLVPMLLGMVSVLPAMYLVWAWGWVERGWAAPIHILHVRFGPAVQPNLFGLAHLWYLQYLFIYAALAVAWRVVVPALAIRPPSQRRGVWAAACSVLMLGVLWKVLFDAPGVLTEFQNGFLPQWPKFCWNAAFFVAGVVLARGTSGSASALLAWARAWWIYALVAIGAGVFFVPAVRDVIAQPESAAARRLFALLGAALAGGGGLAILAGLIHLLRGVDPASTLARRLAALANATFWIYILHLLFQGLASVLLYKVGLPVGLKLAIVFVAGAAGPLGCYTLARRWRLFAWLRPVRERARPTHPANDPPPARA